MHVAPAPQLVDTDAAAATRKIRCLWLTKGLGRGGVERLLLDMLPYVDTSRFDVEVAYVLPFKDNYRAPMEELGVAVHCLGTHRRGDPRWVISLHRLLRERQYDIIHTHAPVPGSAARLLRYATSAPIMVHTEHNLWARYRFPTRVLNAMTYGRNTTAIAVSDTVAGSIRPPFRSRRPDVHTVLHGTVLSSVRSFSGTDRKARRLALGLPPDGEVIGCVANFTPKKNHRLLIEAFRTLKEFTDARLVLVGTGPLQDELAALVQAADLDDRVHFLGSRDDVFELLPLFDIFCLSSQFEGFPISLVEAMASGVACVATSVGGIPEIIVDGHNGLLVPPGDRHSLSEALRHLLRHDDVRYQLAEAGRTSAEALDLQHAVAFVEGCYDRALATES